MIGPNVQMLQALGEKFRQRLDALPDITHTKVSMEPGPPKLVFDLDEEKLRRGDLSRVEVAATIDAADQRPPRGETRRYRAPASAGSPGPGGLVGHQRTGEFTHPHLHAGVELAVPLAALGRTRLIPDTVRLIASTVSESIKFRAICGGACCLRRH